MTYSHLSGLLLAAFIPSACGGSKPTPADPAPAPAPSSEVLPTPDTAVTPSDTPPTASAEATPGGGRMAFVQCPDKRPEMCTHLYKPVCAEVDNGVRCVTTPCNSTDKKNYGNSCSACADPKVHGHWPVPCEQLGNDG